MSKHKITISMGDALNLAHTQVTPEIIEWSRELWKEYEASQITGEYAQDMPFIISTAFMAGVTQGISEERSEVKTVKSQSERDRLIWYTTEHLRDLDDRMLRFIYGMVIRLI